MFNKSTILFSVLKTIPMVIYIFNTTFQLVNYFVFIFIFLLVPIFLGYYEAYQITEKVYSKIFISTLFSTVIISAFLFPFGGGHGGEVFMVVSTNFIFGYILSGMGGAIAQCRKKYTTN